MIYIKETQNERTEQITINLFLAYRSKIFYFIVVNGWIYLFEKWNLQAGIQYVTISVCWHVSRLWKVTNFIGDKATFYITVRERRFKCSLSHSRSTIPVMFHWFWPHYAANFRQQIWNEITIYTERPKV